MWQNRIYFLNHHSWGKWTKGQGHNLEAWYNNPGKRRQWLGKKHDKDVVKSSRAQDMFCTESVRGKDRQASRTTHWLGFKTQTNQPWFPALGTGHIKPRGLPWLCAQTPPFPAQTPPFFTQTPPFPAVTQRTLNPLAREADWPSWSDPCPHSSTYSPSSTHIRIFFLNSWIIPMCIKTFLSPYPHLPSTKSHSSACLYGKLLQKSSLFAIAHCILNLLHSCFLNTLTIPAPPKQFLPTSPETSV